MKLWNRMCKGLISIACIAFSIMLFTACGKQEEKIEFAQREDYSEKEQEFIEEYNRVLAAEEIPDSMQDIPEYPQSSDFAIIFLEEKDYGTPAFSFLPLETRKLTEEELLQLMFAYKKAKPETILQDYCSYKEKNSEERDVRSNRELTTKEYFMVRISLLSQYLMEERRPKRQDDQLQMGGEALQFITQDHSEVWIYPNRSMSDEQLLRVIDKKYGEVPEDYYKPKEGQIAYKEAKSKAEELLKQYITDKKYSDIYVIYGSGTTGMRNIPDFWTAYVHMGGQDNDFYMQFEADSGELTEWSRYPKDFYSVKGFSGEALMEEPVKATVTDEQLLKVSRSYAERISDKEESGLEQEAFVYSNEEEQARGIVTVKLKKGEIQISINKADLSIYQVKVAR